MEHAKYVKIKFTRLYREKIICTESYTIRSTIIWNKRHISTWINFIHNKILFLILAR